jgi:hypothetical protein
MTNTKKELEVDFIGHQEPLTKEEELKISEFFKVTKPKGPQRGVRLSAQKKRKNELK